MSTSLDSLVNNLPETAFNNSSRHMGVSRHVQPPPLTQPSLLKRTH